MPAPTRATRPSPTSAAPSSSRTSRPELYRVEAALQGFKSFIRSGVPLAVQQQFRLDVVLEIGQMAEAVDVVANASVLDTMTSSVGKVVDNARIQALPLNTRNIYGLIYLTPGVAGGIGNSHNQVGYSVNGVRGGLMETLVDGSSAAFPTVNGFHGISVFPSVDAVQEFKVQGGNYSAEFGRSLGSVLNLVYKSGANAFHGTAYEFYRDSAARLEHLLQQAARRPAGRLLAQPVRRHDQRADRPQPDVLHGVVRRAAAEQLSRAPDDGADGA